MEKIPPLGATDPNTPYIDGNVAAGIEGNPVPAQFFNHVNAEITNAIIDAGLTPDPDNLTQLAEAIRSRVGKHLGEVFYFPGRTPPFGAVVADGSLVRRDMYPDLWKFAQEQNLVVTEAAWQVQATSQGSVGVYSSGDGSTTFRLPLLTDYFRGAADPAKVGTWLKPSIIPVDWTKSAASVCGIYNNIDDNKATSDKLYGLEPILNEALYAGAATATQSPGNQVSATAALYSAVRPATIYMLPCIHAYNSVIPDAQADMHAMMAALSGKVDRVDWVTLVEEKAWKLPNGLIIQLFTTSSNLPANSDTAVTAVFPVTFPNKCLQVLPGLQSSAPRTFSVSWHTITNANVKVYYGNAGATAMTGAVVSIMAIGM